MGFNSTAIVGDSRTVIKKCQTTAPDKSIIGELIRDIQSKKVHFQEIDFQFVHRSKNGCAHNLAHEALKRVKKSTWWEQYWITSVAHRKKDGRYTQIEAVSWENYKGKDIREGKFLEIAID